MSQSLAKVAQRFGVDTELLDQFHARLSQADQQALDDLLDSTKLYQMAANLAAAGQPIELLLITMLLEEHKKISYLFDQLTYYQQKYYYHHQ